MTQPDLFADMERDEALATEWTGAPLTYTADYYTPLEFWEAIERWTLEHGRFGIWPFSHMWHLDFGGDDLAPVVILCADARYSGFNWPDCKRHDDHSHMPNRLAYQANCDQCRWHEIADSSCAARTAATAHLAEKHEVGA